MKIPFYKNILAALATGCFFLCSCENKLAEVAAINTKGIGKDEAKKVVIHYTVNGKRKAILTGPIMYRVQDTVTYLEFPKGMHVDFYGLTDSVESKVDARYAKYKDSQSKMFLKDSVRVINILGDTLYCDELYWDRSITGAEFFTDKPVRIRRKTQIIDGVGMDARQDFTEWHIVHPKGFVKVSNAEFPN